MAHYVLLFRGQAPSAADLETIERAPGVRIVDHSVTRALLVDASAPAAARLSEQLPDWLVHEEAAHDAPGPARQRPRQAP